MYEAWRRADPPRHQHRSGTFCFRSTVRTLKQRCSLVFVFPSPFDGIPTLRIMVAKARYIFCAKPNGELSPAYLDGEYLARQLSNSGVAAAARSASVSLPSGRRANKEAFFREFKAFPRVLQRSRVILTADSVQGRSGTASRRTSFS